MSEAVLAGLELDDLHKQFGDTVAVAGLSLSISPAEIVALLGPSGCGKSTVLHLTAGLLEPDRGEVLWDGESLAGVPPHRRGFGLMFQEFALFPHMNVYDNVAFGLRMNHLRQEEIRARVSEVLDLVGLKGFEKREVDILSGGERQRVALARSLAPEPKLLMLDEPLGALDRTLKERLMFELPQILRQLEQTVLYVTHDQEEAFSLADRVAVMSEGRLVQVGAPEKIYASPASPFVAQFLGLNNLLEADPLPEESHQVQTAIGRIPVPSPVDEPVTLLIRPESASLAGESGFSLEGQLIERSFRGTTQRVVMQLDGEVNLSFDFASSRSLPAVGERLRISLDPDKAVQILR